MHPTQVGLFRSGVRIQCYVRFIKTHNNREKTEQPTNLPFQTEAERLRRELEVSPSVAYPDPLRGARRKSPNIKGRLKILPLFLLRHRNHQGGTSPPSTRASFRATIALPRAALQPATFPYSNADIADFYNSQFCSC